MHICGQKLAAGKTKYTLLSLVLYCTRLIRLNLLNAITLTSFCCHAISPKPKNLHLMNLERTVIACINAYRIFFCLVKVNKILVSFHSKIQIYAAKNFISIGDKDQQKSLFYEFMFVNKQFEFFTVLQKGKLSSTRCKAHICTQNKQTCHNSLFSFGR